jgi:predicted lipid-binding transport protein (Tim44 family)
MKRFLILALGAIAAVAVVAADSAEAARMGGGRSLGAQRQAMPPPSSSTSVAPASPGAGTQALPPKVAPAASGASRWMGPLAGLAAGIGLAALLSHFGLSEGFADILMLALIVFGGIFLIRMFLARRGPAPAPMQYAGATPGAAAGDSATPLLPASSGVNAFQPAIGVAARAVETPASGKFPAGFEPAPFVQQATFQFRKLQAAFDAGDRKALADVLTPEMFVEIDRELAERGAHTPTEVDALDASIVEVTTEGDRHWASVHFTGMLREDGAVLPKPFDEVWNLVKPVDGTTGWLLAGIRQLA